MKTYGLEMQGKLVLQKIQSLPTWTPYDEGRLVYVVDEDTYYIGGISDWIELIKGKISNKQIRASEVLVDSLLDYFDPLTKVNSALDGLADGQAIRNKAIVTRHLTPEIIRKEHIKFGLNPDLVKAADIPCKDIINSVDTPRNSNIQDVIDGLISKMAMCVNKKIQLSSWSYNIVDEVYVATLYYHPIRQGYVNVQCFDEQGAMILPSKIKVIPDTRQVEISVPYRLVLNVVITG